VLLIKKTAQLSSELEFEIKTVTLNVNIPLNSSVDWNYTNRNLARE
jgi:hypothetical protein